eukprot:s1066_g5.t1
MRCGGRGLLVPLQGATAKVLLHGAAVTVVCSRLRALGRLLVPRQGAAAVCRCRALLFRMACALWKGHAGVAAVCRCSVLLARAALKVACALGKRHVGATARCRCRVSLQGAAPKMVCALGKGHAGATAGSLRNTAPGCCLKGVAVRDAAAGLQGAAAKCFEGCCLRVLWPERRARFEASLPVPLEGAAARWCFKVLLLKWSARLRDACWR